MGSVIASMHAVCRHHRLRLHRDRRRSLDAGDGRDALVDVSAATNDSHSQRRSQSRSLPPSRSPPPSRREMLVRAMGGPGRTSLSASASRVSASTAVWRSHQSFSARVCVDNVICTFKNPPGTDSAARRRCNRHRETSDAQTPVDAMAAETQDAVSDAAPSADKTEAELSRDGLDSPAGRRHASGGGGGGDVMEPKDRHSAWRCGGGGVAGGCTACVTRRAARASCAASRAPRCAPRAACAARRARPRRGRLTPRGARRRQRRAACAARRG